MLFIIISLALNFLFGQADGILDKSISAILGAAGGMAVPSLILWHMLRSFIPEERKSFMQALSEERAAFAAMIDRSTNELAEQRRSFQVSLKEVTEHCKEEITAVDNRWKLIIAAGQGGGNRGLA